MMHTALKRYVLHIVSRLFECSIRKTELKRIRINLVKHAPKRKQVYASTQTEPSGLKTRVF